MKVKASPRLVRSTGELQTDRGARVRPPALSKRARDAARSRARRRRSLRSRLRSQVLPTPWLADVVPGVLLTQALTGSAAFTGVAVLTAVLLNAHASVYRRRLSLSALDETPMLAVRVVLGCFMAELVNLARGVPSSTATLITLALLWAASSAVLRAVGYVMLRRRRRQRRHMQNALIVGVGQVGAQLAHNLREHPDYGLHPVGMIDDDPFVTEELAAKSPTPIVGGTSDLTRLVLEHDVRTVLFAFTSVPESDLVSLIRSCDRVDCEMYVVPRLFEFNTRSSSGDFIWGLPVVKIARPAFRSPMRWTKRLVDLVVASVALLAAAPVLLLCAVAVRLETGGVLFRQQRVGLDGRTFPVLKFQSLKPADAAEAETTWNVANDERIGPIGSFLRKTSLDELPQLWNVIRGDMSMVGPRPERPHFAREFARRFPRYSARSRVPAGLTGWAQIHSLRGDTSIAERAIFDNYYIEHWSPWTDIKILLRTVPTVLLRQGG